MNMQVYTDGVRESLGIDGMPADEVGGHLTRLAQEISLLVAQGALTATEPAQRSAVRGRLRLALWCLTVLAMETGWSLEDLLHLPMFGPPSLYPF